MEINEPVFYDRLREIESRITNLYFSIILPRPKDYDKEKLLEDYRKFGEAVHEETVKLNDILSLVQPNTLDFAISLFMNLFKDEIAEAANAKNRTFPRPGFAQPYEPLPI